MSHEHSSAAVALAAQLVHRLAGGIVRYRFGNRCAISISPIRDPFIEKFHVPLPKVCDDLRAAVSY